MDDVDATKFLFTIAKTIKQSFESPVIFFTMKDYADEMFECMKEMRKVMIEEETSAIVDNIVTVHQNWLMATKEIESFQKRIRETPRDMITRAIDFTIKRTAKRKKTFHKYIESVKSTMTPDEKNCMHTDMEILADMQETVNAVLLDKQVNFLTVADQREFWTKVYDEVEELANWLDWLNDNLSVYFSTLISSNAPKLLSDLAKTLEHIVDEMTCPYPLDIQNIANHDVRPKISHDLEVDKITQKICALSDRLRLLETENSSAVMALEHRKSFLEERLQSLVNVRVSLKALKTSSITTKAAPGSVEVNIFNHRLPANERATLVERLVNIWENIIRFPDIPKKSIISILSTATLKEIFEDELGRFMVDGFGRKLYFVDGDAIMYQVNEKSRLVPLTDDDEHIYYYDECGRYYLDETSTRVYKANKSASEYELHSSGKMLMKIKEVRDGVTYYYDHLGRYSLNERHEHVYYDDEGRLMTSDSLGNLVYYREDEPESEQCPPVFHFIEECKWLKREVGDALKECLADVIIRQPPDPLAYLSARLINYRKNIEARDRRKQEEEELLHLRAAHMDPKSTPVSPSDCGEYEESTIADSNLRNYQTLYQPDD